MLRQVFHLVIAACLWVVFFLYWTIVMRRPMNPDTKTALAILSILTLASAACLLWWVAYNRRLHRRLGERRVRRRTPAPPATDYLGRTLVMEDAEALRRAGYIRVLVRDRGTSGRKVFWPSEP